MVMVFDCLKILLVAFAIAGAISGLVTMAHVVLHAIHSLLKAPGSVQDERRAA